MIIQSWKLGSNTQWKKCQKTDRKVGWGGVKAYIQSDRKLYVFYAFPYKNSNPKYWLFKKKLYGGYPSPNGDQKNRFNRKYSVNMVADSFLMFEIKKGKNWHYAQWWCWQRIKIILIYSDHKSLHIYAQGPKERQSKVGIRKAHKIDWFY